MNRLPQRRSIRLPEYDYSNIGCYYLTICTQNRELYFENNNIKQMIDNQWQELKNKFPNIDLDEWIVMPNHLHGIIVITNNNPDNDCMGDCRGEVSSPANITSANITPNKLTGGETPPLQRKKYTLGQIIAYFKYQSTVKKQRPGSLISYPKNMFQKVLKILTIKVPTWIGILVYTFALVETILLVVGYFNPDLFVNLLMRL